MTIASSQVSIPAESLTGGDVVMRAISPATLGGPGSPVANLVTAATCEHRPKVARFLAPRIGGVTWNFVAEDQASREIHKLEFHETSP
ncbi:hypothetical protein ACQP0U_21520 [Micromonospora sp. CA-269861]|uniref:hypothetical protein n=1 Tax=Micromonospora sp. CA-269861 TaxID=3239968 RepID=UPI003D904C9D